MLLFLSVKQIEMTNTDQTVLIYGYLIIQIPENHTKFAAHIETCLINSLKFNQSNKLNTGYQKLVEKIHHKKVVFYKTIHPNDEYIEKLIIKFCCSPMIIDNLDNIDIIHSLSFTKTPILYIVNGSVFSWRIIMMCYHYKINFVTHRLKVMCQINQCQTKDFTDIAPRQKTPVWVSDHGIIYESLAIILHLTNIYKLTDTQDLTKYGSILRMIMESENLIVQLRNYDNLLYHPERIPTLDKTKIEKYIDQELNHWSRYLGKYKYFGNICGDSLNLIDITLYPLFGWMIYKNYQIKPMHNNLIEYETRMRSEYCVKWARPLFWKIKN